MHVLVLLNGKAGAGGMPREQEVAAALDQAGVTADIRRVSGRGIPEAAREGAARGVDAVVAAGGDGTVSAAASALVGQAVPLGVLPLGTLNHFAKDLGIPVDLASAARVVAAGRPRPIDVGSVNGRTFLNNSSIGMYPRVVEEREVREGDLGYGKWRAMARATATVLRRNPQVQVRVATGDRVLLRETPVVFIGNNRYDLPLLASGKRSALDRGELCVYLAHRPGRMGLLRIAARALVGRLSETKDFDALVEPEVWIDTGKEALRVALDGEVFHLRPPLHYRVLPGALRVLLPPAEVAA